MKTAELAKKLVETASEKQASDIILLDIRKVCSFADYFVICSGDTERQIRAICNDIDEMLGTEGIHPLRREGTVDSGWVLLDFGEVVMHLFMPSQRQYYQLEKLWAEAKPVIRIQ